jgi:hypothetical protein
MSDVEEEEEEMWGSQLVQQAKVHRKIVKKTYHCKNRGKYSFL